MDLLLQDMMYLINTIYGGKGAQAPTTTTGVTAENGASSPFNWTDLANGIVPWGGGGGGAADNTLGWGAGNGGPGGGGGGGSTLRRGGNGGIGGGGGGSVLTGGGGLGGPGGGGGGASTGTTAGGGGGFQIAATYTFGQAGGIILFWTDGF